MSHTSNRWGGKVFNHNQSRETEQEYDRLRALALEEHGKRHSCFQRAHLAYRRGAGAEAHALSEEGHRHGRQMEHYNKQASDHIFRENNAEGRVDADTIDLHGQYVEEAEKILENRIRYAQQHGQSHLHVVVGKGNHSVNHVQTLKPRVEQLCAELGLQYTTEENAGRIYVNLTGNPMHQGRTHQQQSHSQLDHQTATHGGQDAVKSSLLKVLKSCCVVM